MELVTRIQARYRGRIARKAFLRQRTAAVVIQVRAAEMEALRS